MAWSRAIPGPDGNSGTAGDAWLDAAARVRRLGCGFLGALVMNTVMWAIILCGLLSLVYGAYTVRAVMAADAGTPRMQEIAAAIQEGAQAYLTRQYTTIAIVGAVIFLIVGALLGLAGGAGLPDRRRAVGRGRLHRHAGVGARQRAHRAGLDALAGRRPVHGLPRRRRHRPAGGGPGAARRGRLLPHPDHGARHGADQPDGGRLPGGARLRRLADLDLRPSRRRHLHQGRRRRRRPRRQGRGRHPRGRSAQPRHHRRQRRRQRRRLRRHGRRPVRDLRRHRGGDHGAGGDLLHRPAGRARA